MSYPYEVTIKITPLCTCCSGELRVGGAEARVTGSVFERDNPHARTDQRVFIHICEKCFVFKPIFDELLHSLKGMLSIYPLPDNEITLAAKAVVEKVEGAGA